MKTIFFTALASLTLLIVITSGNGFNKKAIQYSSHEQYAAISCGSSFTEIEPDANGKFIPVLPGLGSHRYVISTRSDSAQLYFNQGLNLYYSYHLKEALASFKESARFDSSCAMAWWGQALALGPYYNAYYYKMKKEVPAVMKKMSSLLPAATGRESDLIRAMQQRYSGDTSNKDRPGLDSSYGATMSLLVKKYQDDDDIKALYVDAIMLRHKWNFWNNNGDAKPWTPELVSLCENILKKNPVHPAALHYYIHITEASRHPELALHSADVLKDEMSGAGHMVHMATHMYQRNGLFAKGVDVNEDANTVNNNIDSLAPALDLGRNNVLHIYAVQSYCAINAGMYQKAAQVYSRARRRVIELRPDIEKDAYSQYIYMMPAIAAVRSGKWEEILKTPSPTAKWKYAKLLDDFARGLAYVHQQNLPAAKQCLEDLEFNLKDSLLDIREMPFNKPVQCGNIAAGILRGELLFSEGKTGEAIASFKMAVKEEDGLIYREPQEWLIPARQYLGAFLLKMKKADDAEKIYKEDLVFNPGNGWSLLGVYQSLLAKNKLKEAAKFKDASVKAFAVADVKPVASVF